MNKNTLWTLYQFIRYKLGSKHKRGHGIHSPVIYEFITKILNGEVKKEIFADNQKKEQDLIKSKQVINIDDPGCGSVISKKHCRTIGSIAKHSSTHFKYRCLIGKIIAYYQPQTIIELGTSLGLTTDMIAQFALKSANIITVEGSKAIFKIAEKNFSIWQHKNITIINEHFLSFLQTLPDIETPSFVYIDGHHQGNATIQYFNMIWEKVPANSILVIGDIYWSKDMTKAWKTISKIQANRYSIDIFHMGIIYKHKNCFGDNFYVNY